MSTRSLLDDLLSQQILILDGSMGALIYSRQPTEEDYRGSRFPHHPVQLKNCTEVMVLTQPRLLEGIHRAYLEAGSDIIETCTFNATPIGLSEFGLQEHVFELNRTAAAIARRAADSFTRRNRDKPRFVAGSIGPTNKTLYLGLDVNDPGRRNITFDEIVTAYTEQIKGLIAGGVDILLAETSNDTLVLKACLFAIGQYFDEHSIAMPVMVSGTIYDNGRTLSAQTIEAFWASVSHFDMVSIGLNCAVGADMIWPHIERLAQIARKPISCYPNAGLPDGMGGFLGSKDDTVRIIGELARNGWVNLVGGCCGTTPEWIHDMGKAVADVKPRQLPEVPEWSWYSGTEALVVRPEANFIMVGERTNITGSRKFARLIKDGDYDSAVKVAREQVAGGAN